jgi:hypothetical protein
MWSKYFPNLSVIEWFRQPKKSSKGSIVWKDMVEAFPLVGDWVVWKIGDKKKVRVGEDPWLGAGNYFRLSLPLILSLRNKNIDSLHDTCIGFPQTQGCAGWKDATTLGLPEALHDEWNSYFSLIMRKSCYSLPR